MSSSSLDSSSSSSSSSYGGSLSASQWDQKKTERPVRPLPAGERTAALDGDHAHLVRPRFHPGPVLTEGLTNGGSGEAAADGDEKNAKSDVENAVLMDCLSSHFLWSHLPKAELERLCDAFQKRRYRDHEIIYFQGDEAQHVYVLFSGEVVRHRVDAESNDESRIPENESAEEEKYETLGELAVLTGSAYTETARAASNCTLFSLGRIAFHRALRPTPEINAEERAALLKKAVPDEMVDYFTTSDIQKLAVAMTTHSFEAGDVLVKKEDRLSSLVIIAKGLVTSTDVSLGGRPYDDERFGPDASKFSFGWQSLVTGTNQPHFQGNMVAQSNGVALMLSQPAFHKVMQGHHNGSQNVLEHLAERRLARVELQQIPMFQDSLLDELQINGLLDLMHRCEYGDEETIFSAGEKVDAALYFVREGSVTLLTNKGEDRNVIQAGDYFGEANMLRDQNKDGQKHYVIRSPSTAIAHGPRTIVDVLYLEECRSVVNTKLLGLGGAPAVGNVNSSVEWADIKRHSLLGTGGFGQVWLASMPRTEMSSEQSPEGEEEKKIFRDEADRLVVALKVQSKYQILDAAKADRVVAERNILALLNSPFLLQLLHAFQDESLLFMITSVAQGGELESLIPIDGLPEEAAKFYSAGILEGLAYMHRRHLIHRDLKPQNVLINQRGYPVLIDFGFAKYVPGKTYTFVGSPIFTAPEIIRFQGHDKGSDYWAWAVLCYRLVTGKFPFYEKGMEELVLYKRICKGTIELDGQMSVDFRMLMVSILYPNPAQRLGSGRNGWRDIFNSSWFASDQSFDLRRLRRQDFPAPWVPDLKGPLDASRFHPRDESETEDLIRQNFPAVSDKVFDSFGPWIQ